MNPRGAVDMSIEDKPDVLCFEKHYSDQPEEVEFSVRYDRKPYLHDEDIIGYLTLEHVDNITIPITQLDWLIGTLERIRSEL